MKFTLSQAALCLLGCFLFVNSVSAQEFEINAAHANKVLQCQLFEQRTGAIIQRRQATILQQASRPIFFVFSDRNVMGTVKDQGLQNGERHLKLELKFDDGGSYSHSNADRVYNPEQKEDGPLAAATIDTGVSSFRGILELRCLLLSPIY